MKRLFIPLICLALGACATNHNTAASDADHITTGCAGNTYLQKYGCSIDHIQQAAESGDPDAQYALGYMYFYGIGTIQDPKTAQLWIQRAAAQGQPLAKKAANLIDHPSKIQIAKSKPILHKLHATEHDPRLIANATPNINIPNVAHTSSNFNSKQTHQLTPSQPNKRALLTANKHGYTVQLMASHDLPSIMAFMHENNLPKYKTSYYKTSIDGQTWYRLTYGNYNSIQSAQKAVQQLPTNLLKLKPWIRSFTSIQNELKHIELDRTNAY